MTSKPIAADDPSRSVGKPKMRPHVERVVGWFGADHFTGALLRPTAGESKSVSVQSPLLAAAAALLAPERGFLAAMSRVFELDLAPHLEHLLVIQRLGSSLPFLSDTGYRREVLNAWCSNVLSSPGFLVVHPPATRWQALDSQARFQLGPGHRKDLELCVLLGSLGCAQLCDDALEHPIPLLVLPWTPAEGLLEPRQLPAKSFSQRLCVEPIERRRLFEKLSRLSALSG